MMGREQMKADVHMILNNPHEPLEHRLVDLALLPDTTEEIREATWIVLRYLAKRATRSAAERLLASEAEAPWGG